MKEAVTIAAAIYSELKEELDQKNSIGEKGKSGGHLEACKVPFEGGEICVYVDHNIQVHLDGGSILIVPTNLKFNSGYPYYMKDVSRPNIIHPTATLDDAMIQMLQRALSAVKASKPSSPTVAS